MTQIAIPTPTLEAPSTAFAKFIDTFAVFNQATRDLAAIDVQVNTAVQDLITGASERYTALLATEKKAKEELIAAVKANPAWFDGKKSLTTPFGKIETRTTKSLEIENEAIATRLILETFCDVRATVEGQTLKIAGNLARLLGNAAEFLHIDIKPNREALEKLTDSELEVLGIARKTTETITPKPQSLDLGKAIEPKKAKKTKKAPVTADAP